MRFPHNCRLRRKVEFDQVFKNARLRVRMGPLRALVRDNAGEFPRLGMVIAKRFANRAVDRNRVKRQIRESFRAHRSTLPACDVVVQLIDAPGNADLGELMRSIWDRVRDKADERPD
ncbi:MAG: ribonuclease P protein component [Gammaproteobacteria bacterium]|nr:ribonuclease P protein component [Gammaproteobacteria bacterium]